MPNASADRLSAVCLAARHHGPHDTGQLVGQRHDLARPALQQSLQPRAALALFRLDLSDHSSRAEHQQLAQSFVALARDAAQPVLASVEFCFGVRPSQAAKCRPE